MARTTWPYTDLKKKNMGLVATTKSSERGASTGWAWRMILGVGLMGFSLLGITICQGIFKTFINPNPSPAETSLGKLAAAVAWLLFFGPVMLGGFAALWFALGRLGALDWLAAWREERFARDYALSAGGKPNDARMFAGQEKSYDRLETLSAGEAERLTRRGHRIAVLLGLSAGALLILVGVFGLALISSSPLRLSGTISLAMASGLCILVGLALLQRTVRKEDNAWLLPLKLFTHLVLRKGRLSADDYKTRRSEDPR